MHLTTSWRVEKHDVETQDWHRDDGFFPTRERSIVCSGDRSTRVERGPTGLVNWSLFSHSLLYWRGSCIHAQNKHIPFISVRGPIID